MAELVGLPFVLTFGFARPVAAPRRNRAGTVVQVPPGVPRYDHDATGKRLGLLVTAGPAFGQHDAVTVNSGDWAVAGPCTVLLEWAEGDGTDIKRRAIYTGDVRATVNACLKIAGHHRMIGAVAGFLPNLGGFVRYRATDFPLGQALGAGGGFALGDSSGRVLIESA